MVTAPGSATKLRYWYFTWMDAATEVAAFFLLSNKGGWWRTLVIPGLHILKGEHRRGRRKISKLFPVAKILQQKQELHESYWRLTQ